MTTEYLGPSFLKSLFETFEIPVYNRVVLIELYGQKIDDSIANTALRFPHVRLIKLNGTSVTDKWIANYQERISECKIVINNASPLKRITD